MVNRAADLSVDPGTQDRLEPGDGPGPARSSIRLRRGWVRPLRLAPAHALAVLAATLCVQGGASGGADRDLKVRLRPEPGPYYVGQAIELHLTTISGSEPPRAIVPGGGPGFELALVTPQPRLRQIVSSAIGEVVDERIEYTYRVRLVPRRSGTLVVPPIVVRGRDGGGASSSISLAIRDLPAQGRPASFLGGVGRLRVRAQVQPGTVRRGQPLIYSIVLEGSAARGSTQWPDLERLRATGLTSEIQGSVPTWWSTRPPGNTAINSAPRTGWFVLPPIPIAYFDPESGQYFITMAPGTPIQVVDVPRFEPGELDYGAVEAASTAAAGRFRPGAYAIGGWVAGIAVAGIPLWIVWQARRAARSVPARAHARGPGACAGHSLDVRQGGRPHHGGAGSLPPARVGTA